MWGWGQSDGRGDWNGLKTDKIFLWGYHDIFAWAKNSKLEIQNKKLKLIHTNPVSRKVDDNILGTHRLGTARWLGGIRNGKS